MNSLRDMELLVAVVEEGSFARAADKVELTPAMVGRRIAAMEEHLGFVLLSRSTRRMELTDSGKSYLEGCKRILAQVNELEESLVSDYQGNPSGIIRLSAPEGMGSPILIDLMHEFRQQYPDIRFDLRLTNQSLDLLEEHIDLSIRLSFALEDSSMVATKLGTTSFGLYASTGYLNKNGEPNSLYELEQHDCLHMGASRTGDFWNVIVDGKQTSFRQPWALTVSDTASMLKATVNGMGVALIPDIFVDSSEQKNQLKRLNSVAQFPEISVYAIYPVRKHLPYRVKLFLDFLKRNWHK